MRTKIYDEFTDLMIPRDKKWRLRALKLNKCIICRAQKEFKRQSKCVKCMADAREKKRIERGSTRICKCKSRLGEKKLAAAERKLARKMAEVDKFEQESKVATDSSQGIITATSDAIYISPATVDAVLENHIAIVKESNV